VNLVDSSAWLEYFADGPNAGFFAPGIEKTSELLVPTIVIYEVYKRVCQQRDNRSALEAISILQHGRIVDLTPPLALSAAQISCDEKLPMADSIILATARAENAVIWTQDTDFKGMERVRFRARRSVT
jgi:predicted nucleic acid-binding protein